MGDVTYGRFKKITLSRGKNQGLFGGVAYARIRIGGYISKLIWEKCSLYQIYLLELLLKTSRRNITARLLIWVIADKNHAGYPANSVTLLSKYIPHIEMFPDAMEPSNSSATVETMETTDIYTVT